MRDLHIEGAKIKDIEEFLDCWYFYAQQTGKDKSYYQGACDALIAAGFFHITYHLILSESADNIFRPLPVLFPTQQFLFC